MIAWYLAYGCNPKLTGGIMKLNSVYETLQSIFYLCELDVAYSLQNGSD